MPKRSGVSDSNAASLLTVENPEVVRLRIAQQNFEKLFEIRRGLNTGLASRINTLCDKVISHRYESSNWHNQQKEQRRHEDELIGYVRGLGMFSLPKKISEENLAQVVGELRAEVELWVRKEYETLEKQLRDVLATK